MPPVELIASMASTTLGWLLGFLAWFAALAPFVALAEYVAHRWIMHQTNRVLDPQGVQLTAHTAHHAGADDGEFVDIPLRNCLILSTPVFLAAAVWGLAVGSWTVVLSPAAAMLAWCFLYTYLWTRLHRAIHGVERNWIARSGPLFRYFRNHHLRHHRNERVNYGTLFPWTDYVFFTARGRRPLRAPRAGSNPARSTTEAKDAGAD
jgi:hypothetical protein